MLLGLWCLLLSGCGAEPPPTSAVASTAVVEQVVVSGAARLHVRTVGRGRQVVVLLHGGPGLSLEAVAPLGRLVTPQRRIVSFDQRGSGRTGTPQDGDVSLPAHVADVEALRRSLGVEQVQLIGQSWGGLVAGAYAAAHPDRVAGLVLLDAAPPDLSAFERGQVAFARRLQTLQRHGLVPDPLPSPSAGSCLPVLEAVLPVYAAEPSRPPQEPPGTTCTAGTAESTYAASIQADVLSRVARGLGKYTGPALVVTGMYDPFGPGWPQAWRRLLPQATALEVPGAGHMPVLEQPAQVLPVLNRFLSDAAA